MIERYMVVLTSAVVAYANQDQLVIQVGEAPQSVAVTPDGRFAYVTNSGSHIY
ncbi:MAG: hypothetical protein ACE5JP_10665 [Candidatus Bipolaricaulia bacterium]